MLCRLPSIASRFSSTTSSSTSLKIFLPFYLSPPSIFSLSRYFPNLVVFIYYSDILIKGVGHRLAALFPDYICLGPNNNSYIE